MQLYSTCTGACPGLQGKLCTKVHLGGPFKGLGMLYSRLFTVTTAACPRKFQKVLCAGDTHYAWLLQQEGKSPFEQLQACVDPAALLIWASVVGGGACCMTHIACVDAEQAGDSPVSPRQQLAHSAASTPAPSCPGTPPQVSTRTCAGLHGAST